MTSAYEVESTRIRAGSQGFESSQASPDPTTPSGETNSIEAILVKTGLSLVPTWNYLE